MDAYTFDFCSFLSVAYTTLSSCISDVSSQWEGAIFDPRSSEIWGAIDPKLEF